MFQLQDMVRVRPMLFHLTASSNIDRIRSLGRLDPAADLIRAAGHDGELLTERRTGHVPIVVAGTRVLLRDQAPLHAGNVALDAGYSFGDVVRMLNERVYFWPGTTAGPIASGVNHFTRYAVKEREDCVVLVIPSASLLAANPTLPPLFSRCNSGSPRHNPKSGKQPRGPHTFRPAEQFEGTARDIVEVTFAGPVRLPKDMRVTKPQQWIKG